MRSTERGAFTREERKAALWALLIAGVIAAMAMMVQQWTQPSLGPWGADQASVAMPDVLDAQPVA
ncbi:hypothetical protein N0B44_20615 [Roseibacterium beibuensis]|uniref:hypothetical protein n=1 Tax=[Roseibacterium] beibuensis TaxID=1193142 RepID=UPI00217D349D|nr:hypothetical protein [Roseibacterium beibuensis]MCS6625319.1 hypothetical protein [Roseibacterium beibuensis]